MVIQHKTASWKMTSEGEIRRSDLVSVSLARSLRSRDELCRAHFWRNIENDPLSREAKHPCLHLGEQVRLLGEETVVLVSFLYGFKVVVVLFVPCYLRADQVVFLS